MEITLNEVKEAIDNCMFSVVSFFDRRTNDALIVFNSKEFVGRGIKLVRENSIVVVQVTEMGVVKAEKTIESEIKEVEVNAPFKVRKENYKNVLIKEIATLIFERNFDKIFASEEIRKEIEKEFTEEEIDDILNSDDLDKLTKVLWRIYITSEVGNGLKVEL